MALDNKERFSSLSHCAGALFGMAGLMCLLYISHGNAGLFAVSAVYGLSFVFLFTASAYYHAHKKSENENSIWRKIDHLAIFFMIAGTYTVLSYIFLSGGWRVGIITAQWSLVILGLFFKLFLLSAPRVFSTVIYLLMGWMALLPIGQFRETMTAGQLWMLFGGGAAYTVGAIMYMLKKPDILPETIGAHGVFHIFILAGALIHFVLAAGAVAGAL